MTPIVKTVEASPEGRPLSRAAGALLDFLFPPRCPVCDAPQDRSVGPCPQCVAALDAAREARVQQGRHDFSHLPEAPVFDWALTGWRFTPEVAGCIHRLKYRGRRKLARMLGCQLAAMLRDNPPPAPNWILLPIPLHAVRKRERGYNQSALLARAVASTLSCPLDEKLLRRRRQTATQTRLDAEARQRNVSGAFGLAKGRPCEGLAFLLLDDVITTGATMDACARVLKAAGAAWVGGLAVSRPELDALRNAPPV